MDNTYGGVLFFIKDHIDTRDIAIHHYLIAEMVRGFFTKPPQEAAFIKFRDLIMYNMAHDFSTTLPQKVFDTSMSRSVLEDSLQEGHGNVSLSGSTDPSIKKVGRITRKVHTE